MVYDTIDLSLPEEYDLSADDGARADYSQCAADELIEKLYTEDDTKYNLVFLPSDGSFLSEALSVLRKENFCSGAVEVPFVSFSSKYALDIPETLDCANGGWMVGNYGDYTTFSRQIDPSYLSALGVCLQTRNCLKNTPQMSRSARIGRIFHA